MDLSLDKLAKLDPTESSEERNKWMAKLIHAILSEDHNNKIVFGVGVNHVVKLGPFDPKTKDQNLTEILINQYSLSSVSLAFVGGSLHGLLRQHPEFLFNSELLFLLAVERFYPDLLIEKFMVKGNTSPILFKVDYIIHLPVPL